MYLFTTGDVLQLTNFKSATFDEWCSKGIVKQIDGGHGTGNHRRWSFTQTVGLCVADEIRNSDQGCVTEFISTVVEAFSNAKESWLLAKFEEGSKYFVRPHRGFPLLSGDNRFGWPNVEAAYKKALKLAHQK